MTAKKHKAFISTMIAAAVMSCSFGCRKSGKTENPCDGRECGTWDGEDCGSCIGLDMMCSEEGRCVHVCEGRECGIWQGINCGRCKAGDECSEEGRCIDFCEGKECGGVLGHWTDQCGTCTNEREVCSRDYQCWDVCGERECGHYFYYTYCGSCDSEEYRCNVDNGKCEHVCAGRECGEPVEGVVCGECEAGRECSMTGRCYVPGGCPEGMVKIHGKGVCIDAYEATNSEYVEFLNAHGNDCFIEAYVAYVEDQSEYGCYKDIRPSSRKELVSEADGEWEAVPGFEQYPVVDVTYVGAKLACEWWGKELCTLEMWETACGGPDESKYPYGDDYDPCICNSGTMANDCYFPTEQVEVGSYPECEGGYPGLFDMSGNVSEWVNHCDYHGVSFSKGCVKKGGGPTGSSLQTQCYYRDPMTDEPISWAGVYGSSPILGFRCCLGLP